MKVLAVEDKLNPSLSSASPPRVTMLVLSFNHQRYLVDALDGAFAQDYSPLTILVSDDGSTDQSWLIIQQRCAAYDGPHRVVARRNEQNLGLIAHFNLLCELAQDQDLVVCAAGDDVSVPDRVNRIADAWEASSRCAHFFVSPVLAIAEDGTPLDVWHSPGKSAISGPLKAGLTSFSLGIGASEAFTPILMKTFGPLRSSVWAEDQILGFRGVLLGPVIDIGVPLVRYRVTGMTNRPQRFTLRRYLRNQWNGINVYRQRAADATKVGRRWLGATLHLKACLLVLLLPVSPLLSLLRRQRRWQSWSQYL